MKYLLCLLVLISSECIKASSFVTDTNHISNSGIVNVKDFFALGDGRSDDYLPIMNACNTCISNPSKCTTVRFPVGDYVITKPILLQNIFHGKNVFFTINLIGDVSNKPYLAPYGSTIHCKYKEGFGIGMQLARGVLINNLSIVGEYVFPNTVKGSQIASLTWNQWNDHSVSDTRYFPYAGISIDPYPLSDQGSGGSSQIEISNCAIKQWMVGVAIGCNGVTVNAESINLIDDNIDEVRDAVAIGQDQSKDIHIDRIKCWAPVHTMLDGLNYGVGTGGGSVFINGGNIAANMNELVNINADRFPLSVNEIYAESLFKIGQVGSKAGTNFNRCQIDFISVPGYPSPDYIISGSANFSGGMLRFYTGNGNRRINFCNTNSMFRDLTISSPPLIWGVLGGNPSIYPTARFDNVNMYYTRGILSSHFDTLIRIPNLISKTVDRINWTASVTVSTPDLFHIGDYILGAAASGYSLCYDTALYKAVNPTKQIGRIIKMSDHILYLTDVGLDVSSGDAYGAVYIDRLK